MDASDLFIAGLIERVPELALLLEEHRRVNDDLLPHVFMGDVARFVLANGSDNAVRRVLDALEKGLEAGDPQVAELIGVSFVENLLGESAALKRLRPLMGELLKAETDEVCGHS